MVSNFSLGKVGGRRMYLEIHYFKRVKSFRKVFLEDSTVWFQQFRYKTSGIKSAWPNSDTGIVSVQCQAFLRNIISDFVGLDKSLKASVLPNQMTTCGLGIWFRFNLWLHPLTSSWAGEVCSETMTFSLKLLLEYSAEFPPRSSQYHSKRNLWIFSLPRTIVLLLTDRSN